MKRTAPVQKNQDLELVIDALTGEGQGIGRVDGYAVFVPYALIGERVNVHIIKVTADYAVAKLIDVIEASKDRVTPRCPAFYACGGCSLQHLNYWSQLECKRQAVQDALERLGGCKGVNVPMTLGMDDPWQYRNKGSFPIGKIDYTIFFGFYAPRSHRLVPICDCPISDPRIVSVANRVADWANQNKISAYNEETKRGILRHLVVRVTRNGGVMAVLVTTCKFPHSESLISALDDVGSLYSNINSKDTNVIFGDEFKLLKGESELTDELDDMKLMVSPHSFLQVNALQTEVLYKKAIEFLQPTKDETIADVYCGIGTISLLLSKLSKKVVGIENVPVAIEDAKKNAQMNAANNTEFICGNAEDVLPELIKNGAHFDAIVIDPPRKGCQEAVLKAIADSGVGRMVYVSCNPATMARDIKILSQWGFQPKLVQPVDMFPHTAHVECVTLVTR